MGRLDVPRLRLKQTDLRAGKRCKMLNKQALRQSISDYEPGGREFDEARVASRRTSPRSGDGPERSDGRAGEAREQSLGARHNFSDLQIAWR